VILKASMTERIAQGLYDPAFERDSCGFGLIANLDDMPSHWVVETAISALARLTHRGAVAADGKTDRRRLRLAYQAP
jgi:glutamate synthase (NADPH/NADH) large chain